MRLITRKIHRAFPALDIFQMRSALTLSLQREAESSHDSAWLEFS